MAGRDLSRVKDRDALRPNGNAEPYWQRLRPGCFVGYSPSAKGGEGTWFARAYDADASRYVKKHLGAFPGVPGNGKFAAAKLEESNRPFLVRVQAYGDVAYGWAMEDCDHFVKLLGDPTTGKLLGAHIIGPQAATLIQQLIHMMSFDQDIQTVARGQYWVHPALPEVVENALLGLVESREAWLQEHQA